MNLNDLQSYVLERLEKELPANLYYHGLHHTKDVCQATDKLAEMEHIAGEELGILRTAALMHDMGFIYQYQANEPIAAKVAKELLPDYGYNAEQIKLISGCILATAIPQRPHNILERIVCDADLDYLGRPDFYMIAQSLRLEWIENGLFPESVKDWYNLQVRFLSMHSYHTDSAIALRRPSKKKHIEQLKELVRWEEQNQ